METTPYSKLYSKFLDDKEIACRIYEMLANDILGKEQVEKIKLRYDATCTAISSIIPRKKPGN